VSSQLPIRFRLEGHTSLDDYVGVAAQRLVDLRQLVILFGEPGSGKSHLLQGLCHQMVKSSGLALYLPMLTSLEPYILQGLENSDLVCLDDIDNIMASPGWQPSLFHLINACGDHGVKLVLSSSKDITSLPIELPDLKSRLKSAYLLSTDRLSDADKLEVIRIKSMRRGFEMEADVCSFILSRSKRDMHHLARLLDQLDEATLREKAKVTIPFVKRALNL